MKKIITLFLSVFIVFSLVACTGNNAGTNLGTSEPESRISNAGINTETSEPESRTSNAGTNAETSESESRTSNAGTDQDKDNKGADTVKVLVAYFSATNTTEGVAKNIANSLNADLYEITPEKPYTSADLNYNDDRSRSTIEMNNPKSRPAISGSVKNMEQYDIVFIGYPIWWGEAPRILSTFVESYNFSGKTVVPFCTSGGSGVGSSAKNLERLTSKATWLSGTRLNGNASHSSIVEWINGLGLDITAQ